MGFLFGPVPSRRYGRSLGIDLVPMKTCCYDCLFCQLGRTPKTTCERADYVPLHAVVAELEAWLSKGEPTDILTLCGSGEPTLHRRFGQMLEWIRTNTDKPSLLMSNGALFADPDVRAGAALASRVKISLHFWDEASFRTIVRPHPSLTFEAVYRGWQEFRSHYDGALDIEFFALPGINDGEAELNRIYGLIDALAPASVTVNHAVRPPAYGSVRGVQESELNHLQTLFATIAPPETATAPIFHEPYSEGALLALARRHPLTPAQFAAYFGCNESVVLDALRRNAEKDPYAARALAPREG